MPGSIARQLQGERAPLFHPALLLVLSAVGVGCTADFGVDATPPQEVALELLANSGQVPYSRWKGFVVITPERVCLLDSYEFQFACGDRA